MASWTRRRSGAINGPVARVIIIVIDAVDTRDGQGEERAAI